MTWGGKLLRSAQLVAEDNEYPEMSFAEPLFKKRRADLTVTEEGEEMEDFYMSTDYNTSIELDMNQSNVTVRNFASVSPDSPQIMFRVECLERQLETEIQEKQRAEEKSLALQQSMDELQKQLQTVEQQLKVEAEEKSKAAETCAMLDLKIADLEKSKDQEKANDACEQYLSETIQLCERLSFERESMATERDVLKQNLELLTEDIERLKQDNENLRKDKEALQKDKATLLRDVEERIDMDEFEKLEKESRNDYERELEAEIAALKKTSADGDALIQKLKTDLDMMSSELKNKEDLLVQMQALNGKDLVQEVSRLRRSLDDAEGLSLETKKEWAFLRSENLSLKERDVALTAEHDRMEQEVKSLQSQLENEKSRFKKMQTDLQKELLMAFDENTKLTALMDGKVPKNILHNLTLEKTVTDLRKELEKSQESASALESKLEEMKSLEHLPAKVDDLIRQVCELTGELYSVQEERDRLVSAQAVSTEEHEKLKGETEKAREERVKMLDDLADAELKESQLREQHMEVTEQLTKVQTNLEHLTEENGRLLSALEEANQKSDRLLEELELLRCEKDAHQHEQAEDGQNNQQELQNIRSELITVTEERDQLQESLQALKDEQAHMKRDMEENVEMMIENQEDLRAALEKVKEQNNKILELEAQKHQLESRLSTLGHNDESALLKDLQIQMEQLQEALRCACAERQNILSETALSNAELERMQANIGSLTKERDELQEILQGLREERAQLKQEIEEKDELVVHFQSELNKMQMTSSEDQLTNSVCISNEEDQAQLQQNEDLKRETEMLTQENAQFRADLKMMSEKVDELSQELCTAQDEKGNLLAAQSTLNEENLRLKEEIEKAQEELVTMESQMIDSQLKEAELGQQHSEVTEQLAKAQTDLEQLSVENNRLLTSSEETNLKLAQLSDELKTLRCEREKLLSEKTEGTDRYSEDMEILQATITSVTEERNQLQEILQALREDHNQLKRDLEETNDMLVQVQDKLKQNEISSEQPMACVQDELLQQVEQLQKQLEALTEENHQLKTDVQENVDMMIENQNELREALVNIKGLQEKIHDLEVQKAELEAKLQPGSTEATNLVEDLETQISRLNEELKVVCEEKEHLLSESKQNDHNGAELESLKANFTTLTEERDQLLDVLQGLREEKSRLKSDLEEKEDMIMQLRDETQSAPAERSDLCTRGKGIMETSALETTEASLTALSEEREKLLEILQGMTEEKIQMKSVLEEKDEMLMQLKDELQSTSAEKDHLLAEKTELDLNNKAELERCQVNIAALTRERDQLGEENNFLKNKLEEMNEMMVQLREDLRSVTAEMEHLLSEKTNDSVAAMGKIEQMQAEISSVTEERDQLLEIVQGLQEEKDKLKKYLEEKDDVVLQLREEKKQFFAENEKCILDKTEELERLQANIISLTEERDQVLEVLQGMREEKSQLRTDLDKKEQLIQQMSELQSTRVHLLMKDASCSVSNNSGCPANAYEEGSHLQELLQGVRELIQVQGELKQRQDSEQPSLRETRDTEFQQIQAIKDEVEYLKNERTLLRKDLQEAADMSKAYQNLLHSTKEELKQQQKENADLVAQSTEKESQLQKELSQVKADLLSLREQLLAQKSSKTQTLNTELLKFQSRIASLEEEKQKLQEMLESAREEGVKLSNGVKGSEEKRLRLTEELERLVGIKDQLLNEKTHAEQLQEVFNGVREERDQLRRELEGRVKELTDSEEKVLGLEQQNALLQSEIGSLNQSLRELTEHAGVAPNENRLKVISEIETCNENLKAAFLKLQAVIDRPSPKDSISDSDAKEWTLFSQLLPLVPKSHRTVYADISLKTTQLNDALVKTAVTLKRLAIRHKAHFLSQVQRDIASFEEKRLLDVLIRRAQAPSQVFQTLQEDLQQIWDERLSELLAKRKQYLRDMDSILEFLEDAVAKHAVTLSEGHQARIRANDEIRTLARTADTAAIIQFFERELARRTALTERQRAFRKDLLDKYDSVVSVLKPLEAESEQRLRDERSECLTLLPAQNSEQPKTVADLLQDKQHLTLQLRQTQKQMEVIQKTMDELKVQTDVSNQKHVLKLQELSSDLKEKENLIQNLQTKLTESEVLVKVKMPPSAAEMAAMKDKLVKMELDHIAVTTAHEKEITQLSSVLEHREEMIRKLKENLRKSQQEEEHSFMEGEEFRSKPSTQTKTHTSLKEKKIEDLEKKNAHFESLVTKQQEEIAKWKSRAYRLRENKKEAPQSPRTPTKRHPPLTTSEVNSPKKAFLESPRSKFFDVRAGGEPVSLKCPKQFFDNSSLGTMPDLSRIPAEPAMDDFSESDDDASSSAAGSSSGENADSWWHIPNSSPCKANTNVGANGCPTQ